MGSVGFFELLVIASIALIVLHPKDWLRLAYTLGKLSRKIRSFKAKIQETYEPFLKDMELKDLEKKAKEKARKQEPFSQ